MRKLCWCSLRQGILFQASLSGTSSGLVSGAFPFAIRLVPLPSMSSCRRQHILGITPGIGFFGTPAPTHVCGLNTCSLYRPPIRAEVGLIPFQRSVLCYLRACNTHPTLHGRV